MAWVRFALALVAASTLGVSITSCAGGGNSNIPKFTLTVDSMSPSSGVTINASPADNNGVYQGPTPLVLTYDSGASVALTAPAKSGAYKFSSWSGCGSTSGTDGLICNVTLSASTTVTANYTPPPAYSLSVASAGVAGVSVAASPADNNGTTSGATPFSLTYYSGTAITLTAPAETGYAFSSWSGCTTTSGNTCNVTLTANTAVTATYTVTTAVPHTLTVDSTNPSSGIAIATSPSDNNGVSNGDTPLSLTYNSGTQVSLTAPPETYSITTIGDEFTKGVGGGLAYSSPLSGLVGETAYDLGMANQRSCDIVVRANAYEGQSEQTFGAAFTIPTSGSVTITWGNSRCNPTYGYTAGALGGYMSGVAISTVVSGSTYTMNCYNASPLGNTAVCTPQSYPSSPVNVANGAQWLVDAQSGWFTGINLLWAGNFNAGDCTQAPVTTANCDVAADIAAFTAKYPNTMVVDLLVGDYYPTRYPGGSWYNSVIAINEWLAGTYGEGYNLGSATAAYPGTAPFWQGNFIDIRGDLETQTCAQSDPGDQYFCGNGIPGLIDRPVDMSGTLTSGIADTTSCTFTTSSSPWGTITVDSEQIEILVEGKSCIRGFNGTTAAPHANGAAYKAYDPLHLTGATGYGYSAMASLAAAALGTADRGAGYTFSSWTGCDSTSGSNGSVCRVTIQDDATVTANFNQTYSLSVASSGVSPVTIAASPTDENGNSSGATPFSLIYKSGAQITLTAPSQSGYAFSSWTGCDTASGNTCTITMNANESVTANYTATGPIVHTLTIDSTGPASGIAMTVSPADNNNISSGSTPFSLTYDQGATVVLTAPSNTGSSAFVSWTGCTAVNAETCTVTLGADTTVIAAYTPGYTLTVNSSGAGNVPLTASPNDINGSYGGSTPFSLTYKPGTQVTVTAPLESDTISAFGDSLTEGSGGGTPYTSFLAASLGYTVYNMGMGSQRSCDIVVRANAYEGQPEQTFGAAFTIPTSGTATVTWGDSNCNPTYHHTTGLPHSVYVSGVPISTVVNGTTYTMTCVAATATGNTAVCTPANYPSSPVSVASGAQWTAVTQPQWFNGTILLWAGRNNYSTCTKSPVTTANCPVAADIAAFTAKYPNTIVLDILNGDYYPAEYGGNASYADIIAINDWIAATYGSGYSFGASNTYYMGTAPFWNGHFIDIRGALLTQTCAQTDAADQYFCSNGLDGTSERAVDESGTLTSAIGDATTCSFTTSGNLTGTITVDSEEIEILAAGSSCIRGFNGTTAAPHASGAPYSEWDRIHLDDTAGFGYHTVASVAQTALPATGAGSPYAFSSWTGCATASANTCNVTINANTTVTANYTAAPALITPTVTVSPATSSITTEQSLAVTVSVSAPAGDATPTGSVILTSGTYTSSSQTLSAGSAIVNIPAGSLSPGSNSLTAAYTPDTSSSATYASATGAASVTETKITPSVAVSANPSSLVATQSTTVTVSVSAPSGDPTPTGSVVLTSGVYTSSSQTLSAGTSSFTVSGSSLASGNNTITAAYTPDSAGSAIYSSASGVSGAVTIESVTTVSVDQSSAGPAVHSQLVGMNMAAWFDPTQSFVVPALQTAGVKAIRWPGGSWSDDYDWQTNTLCGGTPDSSANFSNFVNDVVKPAGLDLALTADYGANAACNGPGTAAEAASWVADAVTLGTHVHYMTVGNEEYGTWETDMHASASDQHNPSVYAGEVTGSTGFYNSIKAADSTTLVGVDVNPGNSPAWDPTVLANAAGYYDFVEYHFYPEAPDPAEGGTAPSDTFLVHQAAQQFTTTINQIKQELQTAGEPNTPIYVGEVGSTYSDPGQQSMSITQALYAGQILGEAMNDGVARLTWWLAFGGCDTASSDTAADFSTAASPENGWPALYGWQNFGGYMLFSDGLPEYGCASPVPTIAGGVPFPTARALQLFSSVAVDGESVLTATVSGDTDDVRAYAATHSGGTALVLFNLNETSTEPVTLQLSSSTSTTDLTVITYDKAIYDQTENSSAAANWTGPTTQDMGAQTLPVTLTLQPWSMNVVIIH